MKIFIIMLAGVMSSLAAPCDSAAQQCGIESVSLEVANAEIVKPQELVYKRTDGSSYRVTPRRWQLLVVIPENDSKKIYSFARSYENFIVKVIVEGQLLDERLVSNLLPLSSVGRADRFMSLDVSQEFVLPHERPLLVTLDLKEREQNGAFK